MRRATQGRQAGRVGPKGPAVRLALLGLGLVLLGGLVGPPAATLAQQGEGRPDIGERRGRRLTLRSKENPALVAALAEAVKDVPAGVGTLVRVDGAGEPEKLALATVVFPLFVFALPGTPVYDSARLFLVVTPLLALLAARGCVSIWQTLPEEVTGPGRSAAPSPDRVAAAAARGDRAACPKRWNAAQHGRGLLTAGPEQSQFRARVRQFCE